MKTLITEIQKMYNENNVRVLKAKRLDASNTLVLYKSTELKYFPKMKIQHKYHVELLVGIDEFQGSKGVGYNLTNKRDAIKIYNKVK